jgi:type III pantothenate kinase
MIDPSSGETIDTFLVADVGNTRIKLAVVEDHGLDPRGGRIRLPVLARRLDLASRGFRAENFAEWLRAAAAGPAVVLVASVHAAAAARLEATIAELSATRRHPLRQRRITHAELPIDVRLDEPHRVGIDRLAGAAAAAFLKRPGQAAIVVDCGTAVTVNMISPEGGFLGGAILPGPALMARALADGTSRLPEMASIELASPPAMPGRSTAEAIAAGIGWGLRGAIARSVEAARGGFPGSAGREAACIVTGGFAPAILDSLPGAVHVPDLVVAGAAMAVQSFRGTLLAR